MSNTEPTVLGEHEFALDTDVAEGQGPDGDRFFEVTRWLCSCGDRGEWQCLSDNAAYHSWLRHALTDSQTTIHE